ncbi:MAG: TRAP transporter large permease [Bowdeniella nasicola]|nr:TRAP transporter large permease [Bowdeniella nasicola]
MTVTTLVILVVIFMLVLLALRMPVAFALALSGALGLYFLRGDSFATSSLGSLPFTETATFSLTIIPMFILMGMFAVKAKIAEQVYRVAAFGFRNFPGGLGVATVMACAGFAAVSGSSIGTAATMSQLSVGEMRKHGYPVSMATATVAVAGTLGVLIPPSVILVLYAIMTGESVARVLAAGIIPGIMSAFAYAIYIVIASRKTRRIADAELAEAVAAAAARDRLTGENTAADIPKDLHEGTTWSNLPMRGVVRVGILFFIVLGGMYSGIFTPTESAAIGALAAGIMLVMERMKEGPKATVQALVEALKETAGTTSMVFAIIVGSSILSVFFITARVPQMLTEAIVGAGWNPSITMAILLLALVPLGMALESISILVITVPLLYPIATELGFNGIWLAVLIVKLIEIGLVTPPVGINCFVVAGATGVKVTEIFRGVLPFVIVELILVAILFTFPQLSLWLPSLVTF